MSRNQNHNPNVPARRFAKDALPVLGAIFLAISSVVYIVYKSWSNKLYSEKWKDYEDCGV